MSNKRNTSIGKKLLVRLRRNLRSNHTEVKLKECEKLIKKDIIGKKTMDVSFSTRVVRCLRGVAKSFTNESWHCYKFMRGYMSVIKEYHCGNIGDIPLSCLNGDEKIENRLLYINYFTQMLDSLKIKKLTFSILPRFDIEGKKQSIHEKVNRLYEEITKAVIVHNKFIQKTYHRSVHALSLIYYHGTMECEGKKFVFYPMTGNSVSYKTTDDCVNYSSNLRKCISTYNKTECEISNISSEIANVQRGLKERGTLLESQVGRHNATYSTILYGGSICSNILDISKNSIVRMLGHWCFILCCLFVFIH